MRVWQALVITCQLVNLSTRQLTKNMLKQIVNGRILTPKGWLDGGSVIIDGNKIRAVSNIDLHVVGAEIIDAKGCYVVPGGRRGTKP